MLYLFNKCRKNIVGKAYKISTTVVKDEKLSFVQYIVKEVLESVINFVVNLIY